MRRSAPTSSGRSTKALVPSLTPFSPTTTGSVLQYFRHRVRRLKLTSGTTLAIAAPPTSPRDNPSSAVRQLPLSSAPSQIANTVLVLLALIASSMCASSTAPVRHRASFETRPSGAPQDDVLS